MTVENTPHNLMTIESIIVALEGAERIGSEKDYPEGNRYIMLSDTLVNRILQTLGQYTK